MPETTIHCAHCGHEVDSNDVIFINGQTHCRNCAVICADCGNGVLRENALEYEGRFYCENCTTACDHCGRRVPLEHTAEIYEDPARLICRECREDNYTQCEQCGRLVLNDDANTITVHGTDGQEYEEQWCNSCIDNHADYNEDDDEYHYYMPMPAREQPRPITWPTQDCTDRNRIYREFLDPEASRQRCPICMHESQPCPECAEKQAKARKKEETTLWIYDTQHCRYHEPLHNKFKSTKYRMKHEHPYLYYGIELECVFGDRADKQKVVHDFIVATNGLFVSEYDGSVDQIGNGAEFISRPLSYKAWMSKEVRELLEKGVKVLTDANAKIDQPQGCGLHVHMSRTFFEHNTKKKVNEIKDDMDWFFQVFQKEIEAISSRPYTKYCMSKADKIKQIAPMFSRDIGINISYQIKKGKLPDSTENHDNHHYAVVLTNKTIEVRTFKSTLNIAKLLATIQFCRAIAHAARNMKITSNTTFDDIISCKSGDELSLLVQRLKLDTSKKFKNSVEVK